jgi:uncharacterized membrane protein YdfJ with MMPL/SSD domain
LTGPLYHLGRFCARHHWPVLVLWLVVAIALVGVSRAAGDNTSDNVSLPGTCLLVPAVMVKLGARAWWLPRWLSRLVPHFSIEGEDYFTKRDAAEKAGA